MTWVRKKALPPEAHGCQKPTVKPFNDSDVEWPTGQDGDLWRCDECGTLWQVWSGPISLGRYWILPGRWTRWRYRSVGREEVA
jgi:hypothetical protein